MKISVISPVYLAENIIEELVKRVSEVVEKLSTDFEIILVDDCGPDNSWEVIQQQTKKFPFVKGIRLSRNFGQHNAITAGISKASGDYVVLMDCDLQDDPIHINELVEKVKEGYSIVYTKRVGRKHSFWKRFTSRVYNGLFRFIANKDFDIRVGSLVIFSKQVGQEFLKLEEKDKLYIQALKWLGFKNTIIDVEHRERFEGKSSYTLRKLLSMAVQGLISNSERLLYLSIKIGIGFSILAVLAIGYIVYLSIFKVDFSPGWPSIISVIGLCTGLILICMGILGIYIGKIIKEVRKRPNYIIDQEINFK